jgi:tRNA G10  N-methylase Trm11
MKQIVLPKHPAVYNDAFIPLFARLLKDCHTVLDPFAGTGKLAAVKRYGYLGLVIANELEKEWAAWCVINGCDIVLSTDAETLSPDLLPPLDAICTSPTYGNRMADHFQESVPSRRITYYHTLGHKLHEENSGMMPYGQAYREKHNRAYRHLCDLLLPGGTFIINTKNFIQDGKTVDVTAFHVQELKKYLSLKKSWRIPCSGLRLGANRERRVTYESVHLFIKERRL